MATEDDDRDLEWAKGEVPETTVDPVPTESATGPHAIVAELVAAREQAVAKAREEATRLGYAEGQRNATGAFRRVLAEKAGLSPAEIQRVVDWAVRYMDAL